MHRLIALAIAPVLAYHAGKGLAHLLAFFYLRRTNV